MEFDPFAPKPQGRVSPSGTSALSLENWEKPAATKTEATPVPTSQRELTGHDIANLHPKQFRNVSLGLDFYAPGSWREVKNSRSLNLLDMTTDTKLQANGFARENISIEKWVGMRLHMVDKEMPHMQQVARPSIVKGENWGSRIQGIVTEYKGKLPGEDESSHMLICCLRTDSMLISIAITAKASVFDINRAVYHWIFSRTDIGMAFPVIAGGATSSSGGSRHASTGRVQFTHHNENAVDYDVGRLAIGQRLLILSIVFYFLLVAWANTADYDSRIQMVSAFFGLLMVVMMSLVGFFRLAGGFDWSGSKTVLMFCMALVPGVNLILMVVYNIKATARIKEEAYDVGLLGAREAIPDDNHDLRNIFLISLALTACLYAVAGKYVTAPKEQPVATFSPPDQRYSISMPGTPTEQPGPAVQGVFNNHTYSLRAGKIQYAVTSFDLAVRPADTTFFLDALKDGMINQGKISVTDEKTIRVDGNSGRSMVLSAKGEIKKVTFFLAGKTVYLIEAGGPKSEQHSPRIAAFFESFHLN